MAVKGFYEELRELTVSWLEWNEWDQGDLAAELGSSQAAVSTFLSGATVLRPDKLEALVRLLRDGGWVAAKLEGWNAPCSPGLSPL